MPTATLTIPGLQQKISATEREISQLRDRLAELASFPPAPAFGASYKQRSDYRLEIAQLTSDRAPVVEGTEAAIADLTADLERDQAALAQSHAADTEATHKATVATATAELERVGAELAAKMAEARDLILQLKAVASEANPSFAALQERPVPIIKTAFIPWQPKPLCTIGACKLPRLVAQPGGGYGLGFAIFDPSKE